MDVLHHVMLVVVEVVAAAAISVCSYGFIFVSKVIRRTPLTMLDIFSTCNDFIIKYCIIAHKNTIKICVVFFYILYIYLYLFYQVVSKESNIGNLNNIIRIQITR